MRWLVDWLARRWVERQMRRVRTFDRHVVRTERPRPAEVVADPADDCGSKGWRNRQMVIKAGVR